jgi:EAL domain-containing protein (putative c-di-GMP-specific phosphodiesterase class I)
MVALLVCAEGVETAGQLAQLRDEGCQEAQGFLFAQAVPAGEVADLISGWPAAARPPMRLVGPRPRARGSVA